MRFQPAHQSMINRRFNDRASCPARKSPKPALARKPPIHSPASGKGGHESAALGSLLHTEPRGGGFVAATRSQLDTSGIPKGHRSEFKRQDASVRPSNASAFRK